MIHDRWSKLGEDNLGGPDSPNLKFMRLGRTTEEGAFTLMKCILNDYWADTHTYADTYAGWSREKVDVVMSKLYYCWCVMLFEKHPITEAEEWEMAHDEDLEAD